MTDSNQSQTQQNYNKIWWRNSWGSVSCGTISEDEATTYGPMLSTKDGVHCFILEAQGEGEGSTTSMQPGVFQVECGSALKKEEDAVMINSKNGNINIVASNGKVRIQGLDVEICAVGEDSSEGNIKVKATTRLEMDGKEVFINAKDKYKLATSGVGELVANSVMKIYGSTIRNVTDAVSKKDSKVGGQKFQKDNSGLC